MVRDQQPRAANIFLGGGGSREGWQYLKIDFSLKHTQYCTGRGHVLPERGGDVGKISKIEMSGETAFLILWMVPYDSAAP